MKILQIVSTPPFAWATGGCARVVYELSKELVKRGHDVTILTTDLYEPDKRFPHKANPEFIDGIRIIRFKYVSNWLAWKNKIYISPGLIWYLKKHLQEYEIIHLQDLISVHAVATVKYCKKYNVPYFLTTHGSVPRLYEKNGLMQVFGVTFGYDVLQNASKILALNKTEAEQCKAVGVEENHIEVVPNGIDLFEYENLPDKGIFRKKYGLKSDENIVLYLARIHKIKGVDLLVEAFSDLVSKMEDVKLVIAGPDDGFLPTLKAQIEDLEIDDRILFTGPLYEMDKLEAYIDADVYVLPSVYETFPVTVLEASACGTPVIITDRCGIAEIVEKVGCVVEYDKEQLRDAILKLLSDDGLRQRYGGESRRLVKEEFVWGEIVKQVEQIYE